MSEQTIAAPLSGREVIESVVDRIRDMLRRDCYLNPANGYESFSGKISIELRLKDLGRIPEIKTVVHVESEAPINEDSALLEAEATLYDRPPNQVRQESGQPVPTLVTDGSGRKTIEPVKYRRKGGVTPEEATEI